MSVLFGARCRVDTLRGAGGCNGEIALGTKYVGVSKGPADLKHLFAGKQIYACSSTKAQITLLPAPFLCLLVSITFSHSDYFPVVLSLAFSPSSAHARTLYLVFSFFFFFLQSLAVYLCAHFSNSPNLYTYFCFHSACLSSRLLLFKVLTLCRIMWLAD